MKKHYERTKLPNGKGTRIKAVYTPDDEPTEVPTTTTTTLLPTDAEKITKVINSKTKKD